MDGSVEAWLRTPGAAGAEPPPPPLADGAAFGSFRVLGVLGRGGAADVYRARQEPAGLVGALKVLRPDADDTRKARFAREIRFLAEHPHPALPRYLGSGETDGAPWLFLEELAPAPLPTSDRRVARFLLALGRGVAHLHAVGFVHRDIKPDNVLFRKGGVPVLIDLGLVKDVRGGTPAARGAAPVPPGISLSGVGTPGWSAPEQFDRGEATPASDVHALGVLADACFGGRPPRAWRGIVRRATSSLPAERFPDVASFARAIRLRHAGRWAVASALLAGVIWIGCRILGSPDSRILAPGFSTRGFSVRGVSSPPDSRGSSPSVARFKAREASREEHWAPFWNDFRTWCAANGSPLADCVPGAGKAGNAMLLAQGRDFHVQYSISDAGRLQLEIYSSADEAEAAGVSPQAVMERLHAHRAEIEARFPDPATLETGWFSGKAGARSRVTRFVRPGVVDPAAPRPRRHRPRRGRRRSSPRRPARPWRAAVAGRAPTCPVPESRVLGFSDSREIPEARDPDSGKAAPEIPPRDSQNPRIPESGIDRPRRPESGRALTRPVPESRDLEISDSRVRVLGARRCRAAGFSQESAPRDSRIPRIPEPGTGGKLKS